MHKVEFKEEAKREQTFLEKVFGVVVPRKKHTVVFWDSPDRLPYFRYQAFNRHFMTSLGVGNTYEDFHRHAKRVVGYIESKDYKSAIATIENQMQTFYNALTNYSPKALAGAAWIYSIDGVECTNFDDAALKVTLEKLTEIGFSFGMFNDAIDLVKKK